MWMRSCFNGAPPRTAGLLKPAVRVVLETAEFQWGPAADGGVTDPEPTAQPSPEGFNGAPPRTAGLLPTMRTKDGWDVLVSMGPRRGRRGYYKRYRGGIVTILFQWGPAADGGVTLPPE